MMGGLLKVFVYFHFGSCNWLAQGENCLIDLFCLNIILNKYRIIFKNKLNF
jgi:hypothetical protein